MTPTMVATGAPGKIEGTTSSPNMYLKSDGTTVPVADTASSPITSKGTTIDFDTKRMIVDQPYSLLYRGKPAVAFKRANGGIDIYRVPR